MKRRTSIMPLFCAALLLALAESTATAQQSAINQKLLLHVAELNTLAVPSGLVSLEREKAAEAVSKLVWTSNGSEKKVTVAKCTPSQAGVRITVRDIDHPASARRSVDLTGEADVDLLYGLQKSAGSCVLEFSLTSMSAEIAPPVLVLFTVTNS